MLVTFFPHLNVGDISRSVSSWLILLRAQPSVLYNVGVFRFHKDDENKKHV